MGLRVALLRGINVGGHRVKMDQLRGHFSDLGLENPRTFIASGNVVFEESDADAAAVEALIESGLAEALGYEVPTFVRSMDELAAISAVEVPTRASSEVPGEPPADFAHYVGFMKAAPDDRVRGVFAELSTERDHFHCDGREFHWLSHGKISESPLFGRVFERSTRDIANTMRNMNTIRRLLAKF